MAIAREPGFLQIVESKLARTEVFEVFVLACIGQPLDALSAIVAFQIEFAVIGVDRKLTEIQLPRRGHFARHGRAFHLESHMTCLLV